MMIKNKCLYILLLAMAVLVAGCASKKKVTAGDADKSRMSETSYLREVWSNAPDFNGFSAKMKFAFSRGNDKLSVGGSIKMKRDEVIQISLVAIGIVEAAKIEITPDRLLLLDRLGRRYVEVAYEDYAFFRNCKIDFYTLQSLFWNELFVPGTKQVGKGDLSAFRVTREGDTALLTVEDDARFRCSFLASLSTALLQESRIHVVAQKSDGYRLDWKYGDFQELAGKQFPSVMNLALHGAGKDVTAAFTFSRCGTSVDYEPLTIPTRYKKVEVDDILKLLPAL